MSVKKQVVVAAFGLCLGLSGCFDINQTLELDEDGTAQFRFLLAFDAEFLALAEEQDMDTTALCQTEGFLEAVPPGLEREQTREMVDDTLICGYTVNGPIEHFQNLSAELVRETGDADVLTLNLLENDQVEITSVYSFDEDELDGSGESGLGTTIKQMIASNFAGHVITWSLRAPRIVETNGALSSDGQTVTWVVPFEEAIMSGGDYRFHVIADYSKQPALF